MFKTLLLAAFGMQMHAQSYCEPTWSGWAVNEPTEPISLVQLGVDEAVSGAINNASTALVSSDTPRYEDFSSTVMSVTRGESYTLKVKGNTDGDQTNYITVYFDWNGDGVFSNGTPADEAEQQQLTNQPEKHQYLTALVNSNGEDDLEVTYTVTIPTDAVTGEIRMRVVKNYNAPSPAPCSNPFIFGQVEDYTLNIVEEGGEEDYCQPDFFYAASQANITLDQLSLFGESIDLELSSLTYDENGYADYTSLPSSDLIAGNDYELTFQTSWQDPHYINVRAWVDYNQNYQFDTDEEIGYISNGIDASGEDAFDFSVPEGTDAGVYRLRVMMQFPNSIPSDMNACGTSNSYGVAIDYNIEVVESTSVAVESVEVTTENNAAAEIITENGTLQLLN